MAMTINQNKEQIWETTIPIQLMEFHNYPNKTIFPLHWHKDFELLFIDDGVLHLTINGKKYTAQEGDIVIVNPYRSHEGFTADQRCSHRVLLFDPSPLCENKATNALLDTYMKKSAAFLTIVQDDELREIAKELFEAEYRENPEYLLLYTALLYRLLFIMFSRHRDEFFNMPTPQKRIQSVIDYINEHYCDNISSASISEQFGYEETYFSRLFKSTTSLRPTEYIRILRLEKARHLLAQSSNSIAAIADKCGFTDLNYFSRCFKARYGITASQHRKAKGVLIKSDRR